MNKNDLKKELDKLDGNPPYNVPSNICLNDSYYGRSLEEKYGMKIEVLRKLLND